MFDQGKHREVLDRNKTYPLIKFSLNYKIKIDSLSLLVVTFGSEGGLDLELFLVILV